MDRRNFMQYAMRFWAGLAAAPLLKMLHPSKSWTPPTSEVYPKFYHASFSIPVSQHLFDIVKRMESEMDRQTGAMDLEILNRHASR